MATVRSPRGIAFQVDDGGMRARNAIACDLLGRVGLEGASGALAGDLRRRPKRAGDRRREIVTDIAFERAPAEEPARRTPRHPPPPPAR